MADDALERLRKVTEGLMYPSESDAPVEVFEWSGDAGKTAGQAVESQATGKWPVEEAGVDEFFDSLRGFEDEGRFAELRKELEGAVSGLRVFRVGEIEVEIFLIGKSRSGQWVGVRTMSVET